MWRDDWLRRKLREISDLKSDLQLWETSQLRSESRAVTGESVDDAPEVIARIKTIIAELEQVAAIVKAGCPRAKGP